MTITPNIVVVMTDQQRADFTRAAGFPLDTMPFLDALAAGGARFERAYTPMPICAPARRTTGTRRIAVDDLSFQVSQRPATIGALYRLSHLMRW